MIRLFIALAVEGEAAEALVALRSGVPGARWSPAQNLHLTLRFVGEVAEPVADDLDAALSGVVAPPFELALCGVGAFEEGGRPTALWAGVRDSAPLSLLHGRCEAAARRAGLKADPRVWKPHVTLAYLGGAAPDRVGAWIEANNLAAIPPFTVDRFGLYSSVRGAAGAKYRLERSYRLF